MNEDFNPLKPFEGLRKNSENEIEILIQKFNPLQVRYALWLLCVWKKRKEAFTNIGCWTEDVLSWLWFPVSLVIRKDLPKMFRPVDRKIASIDQRMKEGQSEYRRMLSEGEWKDVENVHEFWTQQIDQHFYHHALGWNKSAPAPTSGTIESHYRELLKKVNG